MAEVMLDRPCVLSVVGEFVAGGVAQHVRVYRELDTGPLSGPPDDLGAEGPSVRKRTVASCTQCPGRGSSGREKSMRSGFKGDGWPQWFVLHAM
jgi:hypothetical protein